MYRTLLVILALACSNGCVTARKQPFAKTDPRVSVEGLPLAAAGAFGQLGQALSDGFARIDGSPPGYLTAAQTLARPDATPDALRRAMFDLARRDFGRKPPYTEAYAKFAVGNKDPLVRASAVRALNLSRDAASGPVLVGRLADPSPLVRLEAAKALGNVPTKDAGAPLLALAEDKQQPADVRLAAVDALRRYDTTPVKEALARVLEADDFSLAWQARRSLVTLTQKDCGYDVDAWRKAIG